MVEWTETRAKRELEAISRDHLNPSFYSKAESFIPKASLTGICFICSSRNSVKRLHCFLWETSFTNLIVRKFHLLPNALPPVLSTRCTDRLISYSLQDDLHSTLCFPDIFSLSWIIPSFPLFFLYFPPPPDWVTFFKTTVGHNMNVHQWWHITEIKKVPRL